VIGLAQSSPDFVYGFEDEVWWSREAQPQMHSWAQDQPVRLLEKSVAKNDPDGKAIACYGLYLPSANQMLLRFVSGRPLSWVTCAFLAWLALHFAAKGKRALFLIWDNATWHNSLYVRQWLKVHNRTAKHHGGCRLILCRLPSKSPWLNPIEPKWLHGKRAIVEPTRTLSMPELIQRVCDYYHSDFFEPITK
jgi:hypothetical protein